MENWSPKRWGIVVYAASIAFVFFYVAFSIWIIHFLFDIHWLFGVVAIGLALGGFIAFLIWLGGEDNDFEDDAYVNAFRRNWKK